MLNPNIYTSKLIETAAVYAKFRGAKKIKRQDLMKAMVAPIKGAQCAEPSPPMSGKVISILERANAIRIENHEAWLLVEYVKAAILDEARL